MTKPTECKWCGCGDIWISKCGVIVWQCGSSWSASDKQWEISNRCRELCADQMERLRDRKSVV